MQIVTNNEGTGRKKNVFTFTKSFLLADLNSKSQITSCTAEKYNFENTIEIKILLSVPKVHPKNNCTELKTTIVMKEEIR